MEIFRRRVDKTERILFGFLLILIFTLGFLPTCIQNSRESKKLDKLYPYLTLESDMRGIITKIYHPYYKNSRPYPFVVCVYINDSIGIRIHSNEELTGGWALNSVISIGDSVVKQKGKDIIEIYNVNKTKYIFKLMDPKAYPLK